MSTTTLIYPARRSQGLARCRDYVDLTRPRILAMVLVCVGVGASAASWGLPAPWLLLHALVGTALVAASAAALNQWLERDTDARMPRTAARPIPAGRLSAGQVLAFAVACAALGLPWLAAGAGLRAAALALATWTLYVWVYTPLKPRTTANTAVGAVAGALPVLIGWAAAGGAWDARAAVLLLVVYLWQFPHFMAIAWLYRRQYAAAGLRMVSVADPTGRRAGNQAVSAAVALLAVSLVPALLWPQVYLAGGVYAVTVGGLGAAQAALAVAFRLRRDERTARALLRASLVYLPATLGAWCAAPLC